MKPYYQTENVRLYHADCRDYIGKVKYDLLVTDPPYGINYQSGWRKIQYDAIHGDDVFPSHMVSRFVSGAVFASYVFLRWGQLSELEQTPTSLMAWVKNSWTAGDLKHEHGRQWEAIAFYAGHAHKFRKRIPDVLRFARTGNVKHSTEKPVPLLSRLISCNEGLIVFDPYAGSGSTLLAALECGRKAIGFEIDEKHCETAAKRLERGVWRNII